MGRIVRGSFAAAFGLQAMLGLAQAQDAAERQRLEALGRQYDSAWALYQALKEETRGGRPLEIDKMPDWSGLYTRARGGIQYDPDRPTGYPTGVKFTPEYDRKLRDFLARQARDAEYDPISDCHPPGFPRWLTEPFLREFVVLPHETWLMNEMVNDIRRVYTDGRGHLPEADRYPLHDGDSIGFWDGDRLIVHTNQLSNGWLNRGQPAFHSAKAETVEIWQKIDDKTLRADVWLYDPDALEEPWFTRQTYAKLSNTDKSLRIRYWNCEENQNNSVYQTKSGGTDFVDFTFTDVDNAANDAAGRAGDAAERVKE
jgi:hypothetical protein